MTKLISVLLSIVLLAPLVRCNAYIKEYHNEKNQDNNSSHSENSTETNSEKATENSHSQAETEEPAKNNITFWLETIKKTEPKDPDGLDYIYDKQFTLPIDLSKVEGDGQYYKDIQEALTSENLVTEYYDVNSETNPDKPTIRFENYTDSKISISECYENNWWFMYLYLEDIDRYDFDGILQPEIGKEEYYDFEANTSPAMNSIIEKIGSPTNVYIRRGDHDSDTSIYYDLVWENSGYTLVIGVSEIYLEEYDFQSLSVGEVSYYTPETWAYGKTEYDDANYKEYIIE